MVNKKKVKKKGKVIEFKTKEGKIVKFSKSNKKKIVKYPIVKETNLNNKTRKGKYFYVKLAKGDKGKYYLARKGLKADDYLEAKKYGVIQKKKGVIGKENIKKQIKKIGKKGEKIEESLGYGIAGTSIKGLHKLSLYNMRSSYNKLLLNTDKLGEGTPIVKDKELLEILTREENVIKYKHRLGFEMTIIGQRDEPLAKIRYEQARKTLNEVVNDIKGIVKIGMDVQDFSPKIASEVKKKGYTYNHIDNGKVKSIDIKIIFRKSKI